MKKKPKRLSAPEKLKRRTGIPLPRDRKLFRKDDLLQVITGQAKGKMGRIEGYRPNSGRVAVAGVNLGVKHVKARPDTNEAGGRTQFPRPVHVSNVLLVCPKCHKPTRVKVRRALVQVGQREKNVYIRICKRCGQEVDSEKK